MKRRLLIIILAATAAVCIARADEMGSLPKGDLKDASEDKIIAAAVADGHAFYAEERHSPQDLVGDILLLNEIGAHHADIRGLTSGYPHNLYSGRFAAAIAEDLAQAASK